MDQSRRAFLGALATGLAGAAGCQTPAVGGGPTETSTERDTDPSTAAAASTPDGPGSTDSGRTEPREPYAAVYESVVDSVASVRTYDGNGRGGQGSAFVYDDRHLVTNEHVVAGAAEVSVRFRESGWRTTSTVATDVYSDLAVLRLSMLPDGAEPLPLRETDPAIGTRVVAIGNPFGYAGSVSEGIISGLDRTLRAANDFSIPDAIQTDAAVNPGNSGGPLVTLDGDVAGVINAGGGDNIGFAISAPLTRRVIPDLLSEGSFEHSYMGVRLTNVSPLIAEANVVPGTQGVYIDEVVEESPSDGVLRGSTGSRYVNGIETPTGGDVVVRMDDTDIPSRQALASYLALETDPGDTIDVELYRDAERTTVALTLGERPDPGQ